MTNSPVYCNPLDLSYRFQDLQDFAGSRNVHREGADPTVVVYDGRYFLFASVSRGFWHSTDLVDWTFQHSDRLPADDYAPDVAVVDGALVFSASRHGDGRFFRSSDPLSDDFEEVTETEFEFWDPATFQDDDGRVYLYWGCSATAPIQGVEIDRKTLLPVGPPSALLDQDPQQRGWERTGENHGRSGPLNELDRSITEAVGARSFIEGPFMTKHRGRYYLQYAAPGTQYNTYADGAFVGDDPLGPFEYVSSSPFSSKPGGFVTGAGHGSTFQDLHGNWWHAATMRISVNALFERRVGLFPAGFDDDGVLFCNQNFADYPTFAHARRFDPWTEASPGWMLQSYRCNVSASSHLDGHEPSLAVNEDIRTCWVAGGHEPGEWLCLDMGEVVDAHAIQINLADHDLAVTAASFPHESRPMAFGSRAVGSIQPTTELVVDVSTDQVHWTTVHDSRDTGQGGAHVLITLDAATAARFVRVTAGRLPFGARFALSGVRVFGRGRGELPRPVEAAAVRVDPLTAVVSWEPAPSADGYNLRYGLSPEKLYHSWLVYDRSDIEVGALNAAEDYWFAVDSFNRNGVSPGVPHRLQEE